MGLYPHIPHEEGLSAMREALGKSGQSSIPAEDLVDLARIVLTSNNLTCNGKHYVQILGTAMGTKMAPSFANIFTGKLESDLLERAPTKPIFWKRFIGDIFFCLERGRGETERIYGVYEFVS